MAVDNHIVRAHIWRALAAQSGVPDVLRRLTKAFRLLQAERRDPARAVDADLAAAEYYLFARQAVAGNAVSLTQMLTMVAGDGNPIGAPSRLARGEPTAVADAPLTPAAQDCIGWAVAGAVQGERDRQTCLPTSVPPVSKRACVRPTARTAQRSPISP